MATADFNKRTYNNEYLVLQNLKILYAASGCSASLTNNALRFTPTLPSGSFVAQVRSNLWTNQNSWDYLWLQNRIDSGGFKVFSTAMSPKIAGSWGFVETEGLTTITNNQSIAVYLNTNGNSFSDANMADTNSFIQVIIYRVG